MPVAVTAVFSESHVERLTSLTKAQLRYWDRLGFVVPSYADGNRRVPFSRIYSFRDVVALRTLALLRNEYQVSLQHLREVSRRLSHLKDALWTRTTLYVVKKHVHVVTKRGDRPIDPTTGQYAIEAVELRAVMNDVEHEVDVLRTRTPEDIGKITHNRFIARNSPIVSGTRISTRAIKNFHESGYSADQIISEYPDLTRADITAALAYSEGLPAQPH
jgi:uncharacterized protein (DUF433 family)